MSTARNNYIMCGSFAYLALTQGKYAQVDVADLDKILNHRWCADRNGRTFYAVTMVKEARRYRKLYMHHVVAGKQPGLEVDHIDGNGLNNSAENLRHVTHWVNMRNRRYPIFTNDLPEAA